LDKINGQEVRVQQLRQQLEHPGEQAGDSTQRTEVLLAVQNELENKKQQIHTLNLNFQKSVNAFTTERDAHRTTTTALGVAAQALLAANLNLITAQNNTTPANVQLVTVCPELEVAEVGDHSDMSCPTFSGHQLEKAPQHCKNVKLWMA